MNTRIAQLKRNVALAREACYGAFLAFSAAVNANAPQGLLDLFKKARATAEKEETKAEAELKKERESQ